jgi:predicted Zn finger-like uncharacterized protein
MNTNVTDDWHNYYTVCDSCGRRFHISEGDCGCEGTVKCSRCDEIFPVTDLDVYGECPDCAEWADKHTCDECGDVWSGVRYDDKSCPGCVLLSTLSLFSQYQELGDELIKMEYQRMITYLYNELVVKDGLTCKN